jgi:hypothetical protein
MAYPLVAIRVDSDKAMEYLIQLQQTAERWGRSRTAVYSPLVYAFGIETGFHRRGGLARAVGGAYMLREGLADTEEHMGDLIVESFARGPSAVPLAEANIGRMVVAAVRRHTPVVSGNLRDSFRAQVA